MIYDKATLVQIPSGYKAADAKLYSVLPANGDGDFTVSADADATRIDENGLIESTSANQARLSRNFIDGVVQPDPFLLLEPSRTNLATYSVDLDTLLSGGTPTITDNEITAPDGFNTASKITQSNANEYQSRYFTDTGISGSTTYTRSIFAKAAEDSILYLQQYDGTNNYGTYFDLINGTKTDSNAAVTSKMENFGDGWYRCSVTYTTVSSATQERIQVTIAQSVGVTPVYQGDGTSGFYIWGAQLEQGSYPSSYIPTSGSAVTRTADSNEVASGLENIIGQTEGTVFLDFEYLYETTSDSSTDALRDIFVVGTAADISEGISIDNYRSQFRVFVQGSGMTTQSIGNNTAGASQPNTRYKLAVKYKTGDCSSTGTVSFATDLDGIFFSYNSSSRPYKNQKKVYQLMIFNEALSGSELETITSYKSFGQMAKALLYTIE
jgi:hypothetical protein